ncbi:MAG: hypothetical protein KAT05_15415, partial [Spirochaetes bacterium]|nr:hypothetical protein [Spirochaetota bacterium]
GDYFNNNVLEIGGLSIYTIYFTAVVTLIVLILLFLFLILKWFLISIPESKLKTNLKNITQKIFRFTPIFIIVWLISLFLNIITYYYRDETDTIRNILLLALIFLIIIFVKTYLDNKTISLKKVQKDISSPFKDDILTHVINILKRVSINSVIQTHTYKPYLKGLVKMWVNRNTLNRFVIAIINILYIFVFTIIIVSLLVSASLLPAYFLTGSYSIEKFQPSDTNSDIITFTIKETGIPFSNNYIWLYKLRADDDIFFQKDYVIINATHENLSDNKLMLGKNYYGIWYLNLNTSNLTSGNYMLHAEVTNDFTINSTIKTIKKHDDIIFYIPPKTELHSYNSTKQE